MRCEICGKTVEKQFMDKIIGTRVKDAGGKMRVVCPECQQKFKNDKAHLVENLK